MAYEFDHINLDGAENVNGGISDLFYVAPKSWFDVNGIKVPTAPFAVPGDEITVKDTHTFLAGKGFVAIQSPPQKNKLNIKSKGDIGSNGQMSEFDFFVAGTSAAIHEQFKNFLNTPLLVALPDANCAAGLVYQLGCDCQSAWLTIDWESATTKDGSKGFMGKITYDDGALFYGGTIAKK
jgi:hypothetical protein